MNLPHIRFNPDDPPEHFYLHAVRFDDLFARLVLPLRETRSVRLEPDLAEETATAYRRHTPPSPAAGACVLPEAPEDLG